jgi:hypothetical protein
MTAFSQAGVIEQKSPRLWPAGRLFAACAVAMWLQCSHIAGIAGHEAGYLALGKAIWAIPATFLVGSGGTLLMKRRILGTKVRAADGPAGDMPGQAADSRSRQ